MGNEKNTLHYLKLVLSYSIKFEKSALFLKAIFKKRKKRRVLKRDFSRTKNIDFVS